MQNEVFDDWIRKAEGDFNTANREMNVTLQSNYDAVCYDAQQCAEKYLKAFCVFHNRDFPYTHFVNRLLEECIKIDSTFEIIRTQCEDITGIDQMRYPSDFAGEEDAKLAIDSTTIIRNFLREKLEL